MVCEGLKLEVVAEGIEELPEALKLKALGCGMGQGYFYGKPADAEATRAYIARQSAESPRTESQAAWGI